jgi:polyferredoxin
LCIDACDDVMTKINRPTSLIAYDTDVNIKRRQTGLPNIFKPIRSRTILYVFVIAAVGGLMAYQLVTRAPSTITVIHDRNPVYVKLSDGRIRNAYTVHIANMLNDPRTYVFNVLGLEYAQVDIIGAQHAIQGELFITVGPDQTRELRVLVTHDLDDKHDAPVALYFEIREDLDGRRAVGKDFFRTPNTVH